MAFLRDSDLNTVDVREFLTRLNKQRRLAKGEDRVYGPQASEHALRGTPLVGGRRSSAIGGSQPETALLRKEAKGRLVLVPPDPLPRPDPEPQHTRTRKRLGRRVSAPGGRVW